MRPDIGVFRFWNTWCLSSSTWWKQWDWLGLFRKVCVGPRSTSWLVILEVSCDPHKGQPDVDHPKFFRHLCIHWLWEIWKQKWRLNGVCRPPNEKRGCVRGRSGQSAQGWGRLPDVAWKGEETSFLKDGCLGQFFLGKHLFLWWNARYTNLMSFSTPQKSKTFLEKIDSTPNGEGKRCPTSRPEIWGDDKYHDILHLGMMAVLFRYELKSHKDWYVKLCQG